MTTYNHVYDWGGEGINIDKGILRQFRQDIERDGAGFIDEQDGIPSRLTSWIEEAYPEAFK